MRFLFSVVLTSLLMVAAIWAKAIEPSSDAGTRYPSAIITWTGKEKPDGEKHTIKGNAEEVLAYNQNHNLKSTPRARKYHDALKRPQNSTSREPSRKLRRRDDWRQAPLVFNATLRYPSIESMNCNPSEGEPADAFLLEMLIDDLAMSIADYGEKPQDCYKSVDKGPATCINIFCRKGKQFGEEAASKPPTAGIFLCNDRPDADVAIHCTEILSKVMSIYMSSYCTIPWPYFNSKRDFWFRPAKFGQVFEKVGPVNWNVIVKAHPPCTTGPK